MDQPSRRALSVSLELLQPPTQYLHAQILDYSRYRPSFIRICTVKSTLVVYLLNLDEPFHILLLRCYFFQLLTKIV